MFTVLATALFRRPQTTQGTSCQCNGADQRLGMVAQSKGGHTNAPQPWQIGTSLKLGSVPIPEFLQEVIYIIKSS